MDEYLALGRGNITKVVFGSSQRPLPPGFFFALGKRIVVDYGEGKPCGTYVIFGI
jgi:hypothetical protein